MVRSIKFVLFSFNFNFNFCFVLQFFSSTTNSVYIVISD